LDRQTNKRAQNVQIALSTLEFDFRQIFELRPQQLARELRDNIRTVEFWAFHPRKGGSLYQFSGIHG
jgi:hypothetical protein